MTRTLEGELLDGRYRVEGPDADGYAATDLTSGKRVHIAFIPRSATHGARRAMELTGPHVVRVLDLGETPEGATWIAREHVSSVSLTRHLARRGAMSVRDATEVALAVCDAIAEANAAGLHHGALDASCVHLAWSASGLVDVQVAGIGTSSPPRPRDDVHSIAKIFQAAVAGPIPAELAQLLREATTKPRKVLDFATALVPFAFDTDFASDRVDARRARSSTSTSVIAEGAYPEELGPAVHDVQVRPAKPARRRKHSVGRDLPTIVAPRPQLSQPRRRMLRALGIIAAAVSVALLVLIGTEGARIAHPTHHLAGAPLEIAPPAAAPIAPPVMATAAPSATPIPVVRLADLPSAKPGRKTKR